jgi:NAD(P)H dehydrogenase (quinone)
MQKGIRESRYGVPFGTTGRFAPISAEEQGRVIAEILANPEPHAGQTYPMLGPVEMTGPNIAEIISQTLGKPVVYEQISGAQWVEVWKS